MSVRYTEKNSWIVLKIMRFEFLATLIVCYYNTDPKKFSALWHIFCTFKKLYLQKFLFCSGQILLLSILLLKKMDISRRSSCLKNIMTQCLNTAIVSKIHFLQTNSEEGSVFRSSKGSNDCSTTYYRGICSWRDNK